MIVILVVTSIVAISIALLMGLDNLKLKKELNSVKFNKDLNEQSLIHDFRQQRDMKEFYLEGLKQINAGTFYHDSMDGPVPFEDLEYIGEF